MGWVEVEDASLWVEVGGNGPPLLLLAGMFSDSASWGPLIAPLEERFTVIRPDNRTTGQTKYVGDVTVEQMARDAASVLEMLSARPVHVVGHSLGGTLAILLANERPDLVASLAVMATFPAKRPHLVALFEGLCRLRQTADPDWLRALYPWLFAPPFFEDRRNVEAALMAATAYPHAQTLAGMEQQVAAFAAFDPSILAPIPQVPATAIFAEKDLIVPLNEATQACAALGLTETQVIEGAGHSLHWDAPDATLDQLMKHLDGVS